MPGASRGKKPDTTSRARARARTRDVDLVVVEIAKLIADGKWVPGATAKEIAEREGVTIRRAEEWAVEAGRMHRVAGDVETYRKLNLRRLDETYRAEKTGKVRIAAVAEQNKMLGLHAPTKVDVRIEQYENLAAPQLHAKLIEQRRKLTEQIDALEKEHPDLAPFSVVRTLATDRQHGMRLDLGPLADCPHDPKHHSPAACAVERSRKASSKPLGRIASNANLATNRLLLDNVDDARNFRGGALVAFAPTPDGANLRTGRGIVHLINGAEGWIQTDLGQWNTGVPAISVGDFIFEVWE